MKDTTFLIIIIIMLAVALAIVSYLCYYFYYAALDVGYLKGYGDMLTKCIEISNG